MAVRIDHTHIELGIVDLAKDLPVAGDQALFTGQREVPRHGEDGVILGGHVHQHLILPFLLPRFGSTAAKVLHVLQIHIRQEIVEGMVGDGLGIIHHPGDEDGHPLGLVAVFRDHRLAGDELVREPAVQHPQHGHRGLCGLRRVGGCGGVGGHRYGLRGRCRLRWHGHDRDLGGAVGDGCNDHLLLFERRRRRYGNLFDGHLRYGALHLRLYSHSVALTAGDEQQHAHQNKEQRSDFQQRIPPFGLFLSLLYRICATKKRTRNQQIVNSEKALPGFGRALRRHFRVTL